MTTADKYWRDLRFVPTAPAQNLREHYHQFVRRALRLGAIRARSAALRHLRAEPYPAITQEEIQWLTEHFV